MCGIAYRYDPVWDRIMTCSACGEPLRSRPNYDSQPCNRKRCIKKREEQKHAPNASH